MKIYFRRWLGPLLRFIQPSTGCCQHCGWPWTFAKPYYVNYAPGSSIFFVCEWCWPQIRGATRLIYAETVVLGRGKGWRWNTPWPDDKAHKVLDLLGDEPA